MMSLLSVNVDEEAISTVLPSSPFEKKTDTPFETLCKLHQSIPIVAVSRLSVRLKENTIVHVLQTEKADECDPCKYHRVYTRYSVHFDEIPFTDTLIFGSEENFHSSIDTAFLQRYSHFKELDPVYVIEPLF